MKKTFLYILILATFFVACGSSYDEQRRLSKEERVRIQKEDSAALKIAAVPTLECLPMFVAKERLMYDTTKLDLRIRRFMAQMDCDTAFAGGSVEGMMSDAVRVQHMREKGVPTESIASTDIYWLLISNRKARIKEIGQLGDKMVAMTRFSATDDLTDLALKDTKISSSVFRIQINDVNIRLLMMLNNEMDAAWLAEPYATAARLKGNRVVADSRRIRPDLGVLAFRGNVVNDKGRKRQIDAFVDSYNRACDSLNHRGLSHYADVFGKYYKVDGKAMNSLAKYRFKHLACFSENTDGVHKHK